MQALYYGGLVLFVTLFTLKAALTLLYWRKNHRARGELPAETERLFTVVQPILAGDPVLQSNLATNLRNLPAARFIWIIGKDDAAARQITRSILAEEPQAGERVRILEIDPAAAGVNPKVAKLEQAMPYLTEYTVILDDDTVLAPQTLGPLVPRLAQDCLITGIPFYRSQAGIFSRLVTAFVNANALFTYLPMAQLGPPNTINGMFYLTQTRLLRTLDAFKQIRQILCDDYAIAKLYRNNGLPLVQSVVPCGIITTVAGFDHYQRLMKRWMVFAHQFLRENLSLPVVFIVIIPSFLPVFMLTVSAGLGINYVFGYLAIHFLKTVAYKFIRQTLITTGETRTAPLYELASDYMQILHFMHAGLFPGTIHWRSRKIRIKKDKVG